MSSDASTGRSEEEKEVAPISCYVASLAHNPTFRAMTKGTEHDTVRKKLSSMREPEQKKAACKRRSPLTCIAVISHWWFLTRQNKKKRGTIQHYKEQPYTRTHSRSQDQTPSTRRTVVPGARLRVVRLASYAERKFVHFFRRGCGDIGTPSSDQTNSRSAFRPGVKNGPEAVTYDVVGADLSCRRTS